MYFANPWGLLGLLAIPAILFIHLFQRRFPRMEIGGLHLWLDDEQVKTSGLRRDRLPVTKTLILELILALLLTMLLAKPQLSDLNTTTHQVFVLDNSASMMASPLDGKSFRDLALEEIESRVDETGRKTRVSVILTGPRPAMLAGPAVSWQQARKALSQWQPQMTRHQFQAAWDTALQLSESSGKLVFVTDQRKDFPAFPLRMELVSVGESLPNLAFETARWSIDPESLDANLYLRVRNHSNSSSTAEIVGMVEGREIFRKEADLSPGSSLPLSVPLPGGIKSLDLQIESQQDRLKTDSKLRLIEPGLRTVRYAITLDKDHSALEDIRRFFRSTANVQLVNDIQQADFVVSPLDQGIDRDLPEKTWQLAIGPASLEEDARQSATTTTGPFLLDRRNPVLEGLSFQGTIWSGFQGVDPAMQPLVSVGKKVLLGQKHNVNHRAFVLDIDFGVSNFPDSPDFPILLSNLVEACRNNKPGLRRWNFHLNEMITFQLDPARFKDATNDPFQLIHDKEIRDLPRLANVEIPPLTATGEYEIRDQSESPGRFAVNFFDARESDLSKLSPGLNSPAEQSEAAFVTADFAPWVWMLLIAAVLTIAIWNWAGLQGSTGRKSGRKAAAA